MTLRSRLDRLTQEFSLEAAPTLAEMCEALNRLTDRAYELLMGGLEATERGEDPVPYTPSDQDLRDEAILARWAAAHAVRLEPAGAQGRLLERLNEMAKRLEVHYLSDEEMAQHSPEDLAELYRQSPVRRVDS